MICSHLSEFEAALLASGAVESFRGEAWSMNCGEWVYFDVVFDTKSLQARFRFGASVRVHENLDPKSGMERGFVCTSCNDAIIGLIDGGKMFR